MLYRKTFQGAHEFSAMAKDALGSWLFTKQYFGYTKREAQARFRRDLKAACGK